MSDPTELTDAEREMIYIAEYGVRRPDDAPFIYSVTERVVKKILNARTAAADEWLAAAESTELRAKAWDEGKEAGLREGRVVTPFHDRFRSVNPYRARADRERGAGA